MSRASVAPMQLQLPSQGETSRRCKNNSVKSNSFPEGSAHEPTQFPGFPSFTLETCKSNQQHSSATGNIPWSSSLKVKKRSATGASVPPLPPRVPSKARTSRGCKSKGVTNIFFQEACASQPKQFAAFPNSTKVTCKNNLPPSTAASNTPQSSFPKVKIRFNSAVSGASLPPRPPSGAGTLRRCKNSNVTNNSFPEGCAPLPKQFPVFPSSNKENCIKDMFPTTGNLPQDSIRKVKIRFVPKVFVDQSQPSSPSLNGTSTRSKKNSVTHHRVKEGSAPQPKSPVFLSSNKETCKNVPATSTTRQNQPPDVSCEDKLAFNILKSLLKSQFPSGNSASHCKSGPSPKDPGPNCHHHQNVENQSHSSKNAGPGSQGWSFDHQHHHTSDNADPARTASQSKDTDMFSSNPCISNYGTCGKTVHDKGSPVDGTRTSGNKVNKMEELLQSKFPSKNVTHDFDSSFKEVSYGSRGKDSEQASVFGQYMGNNLFKKVEKSVNSEVPSHNKQDFNWQHKKDNVQHQDSCIITDREKMKETDAYKKVIEEERASRRLVLQTEAEEAQRQRLLQRNSNHANVVEPSDKNRDDLFRSVPSKQEINKEVAQDQKSCIINDREKLKETYEYRKAIEEECASRQRVLQIQAEEAQEQRRLLKRKNAERMRTEDMERRQKQRLDELRETQKKSEEQMNLKEMIRANVTKELSKFEITCHSMALLLQCLGIKVGSKPKLEEVRAACKRGLFTFHPDRFSRADVRQQVEAEEKFKLISRMKQKYNI